MTTIQRIHAFSNLKLHLLKHPDLLSEIIESAQTHNPWFTPGNVDRAIKANLSLLEINDLLAWTNPYRDYFQEESSKTVGLILAGNIPMVGFHDVLSCLIAGFNVQIKTSADDNLLIPFLLNELIKIEPAFNAKISFVDRLSKFDLIIATGSNNTSRYFEYYFRNIPHIIRKNRNSVALVADSDNENDLHELGHDLFDYFGLGCRNVSKIFFPANYNYSKFFEAIESFSLISNHFKYHNNYEYNKAIYLVNKDKHLDNGFLLLKNDNRIASPLGVAYYEEYDDLKEVEERFKNEKDSIQCIISNINIQGSAPIFPFGKSQAPGLDDYADGVNILDFLKINK